MTVHKLRSRAAGSRSGVGPVRTALVLSGGNALGAYQAGAYAALHGRGLRVDWLAGTSIGAVNAAIVAGNRPEERVERLRWFWDRVASPDAPAGLLPRPPVSGVWGRLYRVTAAARGLAFGQPNLFRTRPPGELPGLLGGAAGPNRASLYDLGPLRRTLERAIDFGRLNGGGVRLAVLAVDLGGGGEVAFDTARGRRIGVEHLLGASAFPPEFPPVRVDGRRPCDGGLSTNTPLDAVPGEVRGGDWRCVAIDLFQRADPLPRSLNAMLERRLDLLLASQTRRSLRALEEVWRLRRAVAEPGARLPPEARGEPEVGAWLAEGSDAAVTLVRLGQRAGTDEAALRMYDYAAATLRRRRAAGEAGMAEALRVPDGEDDAGRPRRPGLTVREVGG